MLFSVAHFFMYCAGIDFTVCDVGHSVKMQVLLYVIHNVEYLISFPGVLGYISARKGFISHHTVTWSLKRKLVEWTACTSKCLHGLQWNILFWHSCIDVSNIFFLVDQLCVQSYGPLAICVVGSINWLQWYL